DGEWFDLVPHTDLQPDTKHRFLIEPDNGSAHPVTEVRLDIHPDGGMARLRLFGRLTSDGLRRLNERWEASA
ncbi:MAG: allantoicase, partial [Mycobacterium sp.]